MLKVEVALHSPERLLAHEALWDLEAPEIKKINIIIMIKIITFIMLHYNVTVMKKTLVQSTPKITGTLHSNEQN